MAEKTVGELHYKIEVTEGASVKSSIQSAETAMKNLGKTADDTDKKLTNVSKTAKTSGGAFDSMKGGLLSAKTAVMGLYGAVAGFLLGAFADVIKSGADLAQLEQSFDDLAGKIGTSGDALLATLQKTSQGTISNKDLILASNRAIVLGVAKEIQTPSFKGQEVPNIS